MINKVPVLLLWIMFVFGAVKPGMAQPSTVENPLIIYGMGETEQFYRYDDGVWELLPTGDFASATVSPTGEYVAKVVINPSSEPQAEIIDPLSLEIHLLNLADGSEREIAVQPDAIATTGDGSINRGIVRSTPVWAPDGRAFAWTEQDYPAQGGARLLVYDLDRDETRILDDALPFMNLSANGLPAFFSWGIGGIVVFTNNPVDFVDTFRRYDPHDGLLQTLRMPENDDFSDFWFPFLGPWWLPDEQDQRPHTALIVPVLGNGEFYYVDWETGEVDWITRRIALVSATNSQSSLRFMWSFYHRFTDPVESLFQLQTADGASVLTWDDYLGTDDLRSLENIVLSPSGQAAAYIQDGNLMLWRDQHSEQLALPPDFRIAGLQWGTPVWQLGEDYPPDSIG
ncbi:MAG: hypothetical protein KME04_13810 [Pleurocapsa minor GSE-CHR-MK-17-07R]|nr:hypothetical protein [Pleurocapsa minor GSE-CHR-MK 17-07R]